jgi:hypothetical protein
MDLNGDTYEKRWMELTQKYVQWRGSAIAQAVSRWLPTAAARVQTRFWSSGICG